jgi:hypothetical protein
VSRKAGCKAGHRTFLALNAPSWTIGPGWCVQPGAIGSWKQTGSMNEKARGGLSPVPAPRVTPPQPVLESGRCARQDLRWPGPPHPGGERSARGHMGRGPRPTGLFLCGIEACASGKGSTCPSYKLICCRGINRSNSLSASSSMGPRTSVLSAPL